MGARGAGRDRAAARGPHASRCSPRPSPCTWRSPRLGGRARPADPAGRELAGGLAGGLAIAALDLGVIGQRHPGGPGPAAGPPVGRPRRLRARRRRDAPGAAPRVDSPPHAAADREPVHHRGGGNQAEADPGVRRPREHRREPPQRGPHGARPQGWLEPGQRPEFDEWTLVLDGCLHVEHEGGELDVRAGQAILVARAASGCATPRPRTRAARPTSRSACRRSRRTPSTATTTNEPRSRYHCRRAVLWSPAKAVPASRSCCPAPPAFRSTQTSSEEQIHGNRNSEVVQRREGLRLHHP